MMNFRFIGKRDILLGQVRDSLQVWWVLASPSSYASVSGLTLTIIIRFIEPILALRSNDLQRFDKK